MRLLPLYREEPRTPLETCERFDFVDDECTRCNLHKTARSVCIPNDVVKRPGDAGTLLIVGETPGKNEEIAGRPFVGANGAAIRAFVGQHWKGTYVLANAVRCVPPKKSDGGDKFDKREIDACRPYLAGTVAAAKPARIICLGQWAALSVVGRKVQPLSARKGYSYLYGLPTEDPVPVFFVMPPPMALRNRFLRAWLEEDLTWAMTCDLPLEPPVNEFVGVIENHKDAEDALRTIEDQDWSTVDIETAGVPHESNYRLLSVSVGLSEAVNRVAAFAWIGKGLLGGVKPLKRYLADSELLKYLQNGKYDDVGCKLLLDEWIRGIQGDVRLDRKLLDAHADADLESMAELVGMGGYKDPVEVAVIRATKPIRSGIAALEKIREMATVGKTYNPTKKTRDAIAELEDLRSSDPELVKVAERFTGEKRESRVWGYALVARDNPDELVRANAGDTVTTARAKRWAAARLAKDDDLVALKHAFIDRLGRAIGKVEYWGMPTSREAIMVFDRYLEPKLEPLQRWVDEEGFDPGSYPQVKAYLERLGLSSSKKTKKGNASTDKEALELMEDHSPQVRKIIEYRHIVHMRSTYAEGMLKCVADDGRIHPNLLLDGTENGRMSCKNPNLLNIGRAKDSPEGKLSRDCFVAESGCVLVSLDFSQIELRVAAMLSGDEKMLALYAEGSSVDFHMRAAQMIARTVWNIPPEQVESFHRSIAKTIVFARLYGAGDERIAAQIRKAMRRDKIPGEITARDVARISTAIFSQFAQLDRFMRGTVKEAHRTGEIRTWWNGRPARHRAVWGVGDPDEKKRAHVERSAANGIIQGSATDYCNASLATMVEWIESEGLEKDCQLVLPVYDQLLFHTREDLADRVQEKARQVMTGWPTTNGMSLVVDCERGRSWGSMEKVKKAA